MQTFHIVAGDLDFHEGKFGRAFYARAPQIPLTHNLSRC